MMKHGIISAAIFCLLLGTAVAHPPIDLGPAMGAAVTLRDGTIESFFRRSAGGHVGLFRTRSTDNGRNWSEPEAIVNLSVEPWGGPMPLLDGDGELHFVIPKVRGSGEISLIDRMFDPCDENGELSSPSVCQRFVYQIGGRRTPMKPILTLILL